jgi:hypothetical protein
LYRLDNLNAQREETFGIGKKGFALDREVDALFRPIEKADAELVLQVFDLTG